MDQIDHALDLIKRLDPTKVTENLESIKILNPDITEELSSAVDKPLQSKICPQTAKEYLICDYNKDGESYRSPFSNEFDPPVTDASKPSQKLRQLEVLANEAFDTYRELYYSGGLSSVYCWDLEEGFAMVVLIKKTREDASNGPSIVTGGWDSIHVMEVKEKLKSATYRLTSTVILGLNAFTIESGNVILAGNLTRQTEEEFKVTEFTSCHVANIGRMIEDMEIKLRHQLNVVYFDKTKDIANQLRSFESAQSTSELDTMRQEVRKEMFKN